MREYYVFNGVEYSCVLLHLFDSCFVATLTGGIYYIQSLHAIPCRHFKEYEYSI